ncbi:MAG: flagellar filament capping protein FliD [Betaproteobacteria bacterium]|nr:flagellar filament capping protein FliD [Betaproteobacteria bacterium]
MASISSLGSGSGIDLNSILTAIMNVEAIPLNRLDTKEASYQAQISGLGALQGAVAAFQTAAKKLAVSAGTSPVSSFSSMRASLVDTTLGTVSAAQGAVAGSYKLEVNALAQGQQLQSTVNPDLNAGQLKIEIGKVEGGVGSGGAFTANSSIDLNIELDTSTGAVSLESVRDAINKANGGVSATIIDDGQGGRTLQVASKSTGSSNVIKISGDIDSLNYDPSTNEGVGAAGMAQTQEASDARIKLNGIEITSSTNTFNNPIDGITLTVSKMTATDSPTTLNVSADKSPLVNYLSDMVKAYNDLNNTIKALGYYDKDGNGAQNGVLLGDSTLRTVQNRIYSTMFAMAGGINDKVASLDDLGISINKSADGTAPTGEISLDTAKLQRAIDSNFESVANFAATLGKNLGSVTDAILGSNGIIPAKTTGLQATIKSIESQRDQLSRHLDSVQQMYIKQFTALDSYVASMQTTAASLTQQLASLPKTSSSSK